MLPLVLSNLVSAMLKKDDAPMSAEMHLATAIAMLADEVDTTTWDRDYREMIQSCQQLLELTYRG